MGRKKKSIMSELFQAFHGHNVPSGSDKAGHTEGKIQTGCVCSPGIETNTLWLRAESTIGLFQLLGNGNRNFKRNLQREEKCESLWVVKCCDVKHWVRTRRVSLPRSSPCLLDWSKWNQQKLNTLLRAEESDCSSDWRSAAFQSCTTKSNQQKQTRWNNNAPQNLR